MTRTSTNERVPHEARPESSGSWPETVSPLQRNALLQSEMVRAMLERVWREEPSLPPATAP